MRTVDGRTWLEHLQAPECWRLLASHPIGRVGVLVDSAPEIYPVNYVVDGRSIVFRTDGGNKLRGLERSPSVSFEVDDIDLEGGSGWSVLVKGRARTLASAEELRHAAELPLELWSVGEKGHWVRIDAAEVTGRRIERRTS